MMDGKVGENETATMWHHPVNNCTNPTSTASPLVLAKMAMNNTIPSPMPSPLLNSHHNKLSFEDSSSIVLLQKAGVLIEPVINNHKMVDSPPSSPKVPKPEVESDSDGEISNIDFAAHVNLRPKRDDRIEEQERPMSWEGELSDPEMDSTATKDDCNMDTTNPGSSPQITSEPSKKEEEIIRPLIPPPLLPPPLDYPSTALQLAERILGFTPTQSPLQARHHGKNSAPTPSPDSAIHSAYYSPTQSPVQSRHHLSGFSSPYSHRTTPSLSRNNSDASQYGGSQHSYSSSTTSPISPTQFSPTNSPIQSRHAAYSSPVLSRAADYSSFGRDLPGSPLTRHHGLPPALSLHRLTEEEVQAFSQQQQIFNDGCSVNEDDLSHDGGDDKLNALGSDLMQHSALAAQTGISRQQLINSPCPICGDKISGFHYGIFSCESCKGFFKRTVQNRKNYVCLRGSTCPVTIATRKKCPACRFDKCLKMGMKLEAIREDRTRGGRSTYQCSYTLPSSLTSPDSKSGGNGLLMSNALSSNGLEGNVKLEKVEQQTSHNEQHQRNREVKLPVPSLLHEIMDVEHLWQCNDQEKLSSSNPQRQQQFDILSKAPDPNADYLSNLCNIADHRLYKIVKWCKSLPLFKYIQVDDQTSLLINAWCELLLFSCCFRSMDTPGEIRISLGKFLSLEEAHRLGLGPCIERMLNFTDNLRRLKVDKYEYVAMKVIVLLASDASGLKEPDKVRTSQEKVLEALQQYTLSHYPQLPSKFGELLLRIPDLQRTCQVGKEMLTLKSKEGEVTSFNLLMELLRGDH